MNERNDTCSQKLCVRADFYLLPMEEELLPIVDDGSSGQQPSFSMKAHCTKLGSFSIIRVYARFDHDASTNIGKSRGELPGCCAADTPNESSDDSLLWILINHGALI